MEEPKRQEKRRSVRVDLTVPVKYRAFRNDSIFQSNFNVGRSKDLSVGGLRWAVAKHNPIDTKLDMELELPDDMCAYVVGKVVGGEDVVINGITHRFDRVAFLDMDKEVQDLLMRQVFDSMRRKGMKGK